MEAKYSKLAREQLDKKLKRIKPLSELRPPKKGWIRAIRDALGMTGEQLALRIDTNRQRVARIERDEKLGSVSLKTLRNVADGMDCVFVYGFVPKDSLEQTVRKQARLVAEKRMSRSDQLMRLEKQELSETEKQDALKSLIEDISNTMPKSLWDTV